MDACSLFVLHARLNLTNDFANELGSNVDEEFNGTPPQLGH